MEVSAVNAVNYSENNSYSALDELKADFEAVANNPEDASKAENLKNFIRDNHAEIEKEFEAKFPGSTTDLSKLLEDLENKTNHYEDNFQPVEGSEPSAAGDAWNSIAKYCNAAIYG